MDGILEPSRKTPIVHECDLCVVGGSCTGVFAAVRAARLGAKVAIVEDNGFFGGVATASLVNVWHWIWDRTGERQIIAGLTTELIDRLKRRNAIQERAWDPKLFWQFAFNSAEMVLELDTLVVEAGIRPFLHTRFCAPVLGDGRVSAIIVEDKSGRRAIKAKVFVDATGDGDLAFRSVPWRICSPRPWLRCSPGWPRSPRPIRDSTSMPPFSMKSIPRRSRGASPGGRVFRD